MTALIGAIIMFTLVFLTKRMLVRQQEFHIKNHQARKAISRLRTSTSMGAFGKFQATGAKVGALAGALMKMGSLFNQIKKGGKK